MSNQQLARQEQIKPALIMAQNQIKSLLNGDKDRANKLIASALAVSVDPALRNCSPESIGQAVIGVAMMGLNIDKTVGHCYLVPYGNSVQLQIGYKGMIQLLFRAGWSVKTFPIFECDDFTFEFDNKTLANKVKFKQNIHERDEGDRDWCIENLTGVYVVARHADTKDEHSLFVNKKVIEKLRKVSPNQKISQYTKPVDKVRLESGLPIGIWHDWYIEMATAKAIKRLAKLLPIGDNRASLGIAIDDKADMGERIDYSKTAENGVVIDLEAHQEAKPKSRSVDSLIGGDVQDASFIEQPIQSAPPVAPTPEMNLQPEPMGTMPIPELEPEPEPKKYDPNHVMHEWDAKILACNSMGELHHLIAEMPPHYKQNACKATIKKRETELRTMEAQVQNEENIVNWGMWKERITLVNSREHFTELENEMPPIVKDNDEIKQLMQMRQNFCMQNHPKLW